MIPTNKIILVHQISQILLNTTGFQHFGLLIIEGLAKSTNLNVISSIIFTESSLKKCINVMMN